MASSQSERSIRRNIRVGRRVNGVDPFYEGFRKILCLTPSTPYGCIGPYCLKDEEDRIMENLWQGWKVYARTPKMKVQYSQWDRKVIWQRGQEQHVLPKNKIKDLAGHVKIAGTDTYLTPAYFKWREDLTRNKYAVRYPVGNGSTKRSCLGLLSDEELERYNSGDVSEVTLLGYIDARKEVYVKLYSDLVKQHPKFKKLVAIARKQPVLIVEVDGPHQEDLQYYIDTYSVNPDFIEEDTIVASRDNLKVMLEDPKHAYGHGYVLADVLAVVLAQELEK